MNVMFASPQDISHSTILEIPQWLRKERKKNIIKTLFGSMTIGTRLAFLVTGYATECLAPTIVHALLLGGVIILCAIVLHCTALLLGFK